MNPISVLHANVGHPLVCGRLALFPDFTSAIPAEVYRTGPGAARRHTLGVHEANGGNVAELAVANTDHRPILLLEGETILGNRQHRTLNVSVLIPAGTTLTVPVSCVEQGRWGPAQKARRAGAVAPARLRSTKLSTVHDRLGAGGRRDADQGPVWAEVAAYATDHRVNSGTGALEDVHAARADDVDRLIAGTRPLDGQRGVIAAARGRIIGVDLFDKPGTLARYWKALVGAYAFDALAEDSVCPDAATALIGEDLHIDGQDLGPGTALMTPDGEYEWFKTIAAVDVPRLVRHLGGREGDDVIELLERDFSGADSYNLETRISESDIPVEFFCC